MSRAWGVVLLAWGVLVVVLPVAAWWVGLGLVGGFVVGYQAAQRGSLDAWDDPT